MEMDEDFPKKKKKLSLHNGINLITSVEMHCTFVKELMKHPMSYRHTCNRSLKTITTGTYNNLCGIICLVNLSFTMAECGQHKSGPWSNYEDSWQWCTHDKWFYGTTTSLRC